MCLHTLLVPVLNINMVVIRAILSWCGDRSEVGSGAPSVRSPRGQSTGPGAPPKGRPWLWLCVASCLQPNCSHADIKCNSTLACVISLNWGKHIMLISTLLHYTGKQMRLCQVLSGLSEPLSVNEHTPDDIAMTPPVGFNWGHTD